jgi:hypothetical protein
MEVQEQEKEAPKEAPPQSDEPAPDEGRKPVDLTPEQEARFKRVYYHMKQNERISEQMAEQNRKLLERIEKMETEHEKKSATDRLTQLRAQEKAALEEGDYEKASSVRDQITDLKVDSKVPKEKPKEPEPWLTPERESQIAQWCGETDDKGNLVRPWADPDHENHETMVEIAESMIRKNPNITLGELLDKWDAKAKALVPKPARPAAPVLSGSSDVRPNKKVALSEDEKLTATRMFPDKPTKEAHERYLKAKEKYL